uniref:Uncharacterized protein n=1 Tax=Oryza punctata TaxID=4537 RepID=A0A0E0M234_ORYPU
MVIEPVQGRSETSVPQNLEVQQDTRVRLMHIQIHSQVGFSSELLGLVAPQHSIDGTEGAT